MAVLAAKQAGARLRHRPQDTGNRHGLRGFWKMNDYYTGHHMECPHCKERISVKQAIQILNGSGFTRQVHIKLDDGAPFLIDAQRVNPNTMEIIDDVLSE